jgi:tetrapyrrole methylase family protein/MazG family protein
MAPAQPSGRMFEKLVKIMDVLRSKHGCPWDREQDERSIAGFFLEEVYEAVDAIQAEDARSLEEELGDVLMEVIFLAQIYKEKKKFTIADVLTGIVRKMVRRHPHVFGTEKFRSSHRVTQAWEAQKRAEKPRRTVFDGLARSSPSLLQALQIGQRVSALGFDWRSTAEVLEKVREETDELEKALETGKPALVQEEAGDAFFALANLCRLQGLNPELTLRKANEKFKRRFAGLTKELQKRGKEPGGASLEDMDKIWEDLKKRQQVRKKTGHSGRVSPRNSTLRWSPKTRDGGGG